MYASTATTCWKQCREMTPRPLAQISKIRRTLGQAWGVWWDQGLGPKPSALRLAEGWLALPTSAPCPHLFPWPLTVAEGFPEVGIWPGPGPLAHIEDGLHETLQTLGQSEGGGSGGQALRLPGVQRGSEDEGACCQP